MELEHHFTVPVPAAQAWEALLDVERIAPCMPGATVDSFDGETIEGKVKVKVGPIQVAYAGTAKFVEKDAASHRAVIEASARESRGAGTAAATITAVLTDAGSATDVTVTTDLQITGKPAQFGRGVLADVGDKILGKFADCLAGELARDAPTATQDARQCSGYLVAVGAGREHDQPARQRGAGGAQAGRAAGRRADPGAGHLEARGPASRLTGGVDRPRTDTSARADAQAAAESRRG